MFITQKIKTEMASEASPRLEAELERGALLAGQYRIVEHLGKGGFGSVYLAEDEFLRRRVALKVLPAVGPDGESLLPQLLHEFELLQRIPDLSHVMTVQDPRPAGHDGVNLILMPMEVADGSFRDWLNRNPDPKLHKAKAVELFHQICFGVKALHDAGLAHLDLKPENILTNAGQAKVSDLGTGRYLGCLFTKNPDYLLKGTFGTPASMAPEQFFPPRQKDIGILSDLYALCLILYEICDGDLPFDGGAEELMQKHRTAAPPRIKGVDDALWAVIKRGLEKDPARRFQSVDELLEALDAALCADKGKESDEDAVPKAEKPRQRPDPAMVALRDEATLAEDPLVLMQCAQRWRSEFEDKTQARWCMLRAEKVASQFDHWITLTSIWIASLESMSDAVRCIRNAEKVASSFYSWLHVASMWGCLHGNNHEVHQCKLRAMKCAATGEHWAVLAAYAWSGMLDSVTWQTCISIAHGFSATTCDWMECASFWHTHVYPSHTIKTMALFKVRRCLRKAERAAVSQEDWRRCRHAWRAFLKDERGVVRCSRGMTNCS